MEQFRHNTLKLSEQFKHPPDLHIDTVTEPTRRKFRIGKRVHENLKGDICSFYLLADDGRSIPAYTPGQHLTFELNVPGQNQPVVRCYSLSETPTNPQKYYRITVKKQRAPITSPTDTPDGLSSCFFHDQLAENDVVLASLPIGAFCLNQASKRPIALIAGGVGLTPLLSMLNWLAATDSQRDVWLFYGVRDRTEHTFYDHLQALSQSMNNIRVVIFYSHPTANCRRGVDYHVPGVIRTDVIAALLRSQDYEFYLCGPPPMMRSVNLGLRAWGVAADDIKSESFGATKLTSSSQSPLENSSDGQENIESAPEKFQIHFARSNKTVSWTKHNGTLLELAETCGVNARCSCRAGQCGTCRIALRTGEVDYIKTPQTKLDAGFCLPCVTQPKSDLVLDL